VRPGVETNRGEKMEGRTRERARGYINHGLNNASNPAKFTTATVEAEARLQTRATRVSRGYASPENSARRLAEGHSSSSTLRRTIFIDAGKFRKNLGNCARHRATPPETRQAARARARACACINLSKAFKDAAFGIPRAVLFADRRRAFRYSW